MRLNFKGWAYHGDAAGKWWRRVYVLGLWTPLVKAFNWRTVK
jgi:hypothetical protein